MSSSAVKGGTTAKEVRVWKGTIQDKEKQRMDAERSDLGDCTRMATKNSWVKRVSQKQQYQRSEVLCPGSNDQHNNDVERWEMVDEREG